MSNLVSFMLRGKLKLKYSWSNGEEGEEEEDEAVLLNDYSEKD